MNKLIHLVAETMLAGLMLLLYAGQAQAGDELLVDDDGEQCSDAPYSDIQAAVDAAAILPGSQKIHVCEGTYPENVTIGDSIEIFGDGADKTFVTGMDGTAGPIFDVTDAGVVNIEKLTVDGGSAMEDLVGTGVVWGVRYTDTDGLFKDNAILNIRNDSGSRQGVAIRIETVSGTAYVDVEDNLVQNFTRVGINGNGIGVFLYVKDNDVIGPVNPKVWAPNGIQVARGAVGQVEGNHVQGPTSPNPPAGAGSGILLFCAGASMVEGNKVFDSDLGIALGDTADALVIGNEVYDSLFDAYSLQFIGDFFGLLGCPNDPNPSPTNNNLLEGNKAFGSADTGVSLVNFRPSFDPLTPVGNVIENTDIKDSGIDGIHVFDGERNVFENNQIENSGTTDCVDDTAANTWTENDGDTSSPAGLCTD